MAICLFYKMFTENDDQPLWMNKISEESQTTTIIIDSVFGHWTNASQQTHNKL